MENKETIKELLPAEVIDLLKRAASFLPLYIPTEAHREHNQLKLDILKCLDRYGTLVDNI